ncbi:HD-GYP domain-containing protein [Thermodesulfovibrio hydrogeniphilus]
MSTEIKHVEDFIDIELDKIPTTGKVPCNVYFHEDNTIKELVNAGNLFTSVLKSALREKGIGKVYIKREDRDIFFDFINKTKPDNFFESLLKRIPLDHEKYCKVEKEIIKIADTLPFDIYHYDGRKLTLAVKANTNIADSINSLQEGDLLIKKSDLQLYKELLKTIKPADEKKDFLLRERAKILILELYTEAEQKENIENLFKNLSEIIDKIIENLSTNIDLFDNLNILKKHSNYDYIHSLNVTVLALSVGLKANLDEKSLKNLGVAGALHDIGKIKISPIILSKMGKLSAHEFEIYKTHVIESVKIASKLGVSEETKNGILHHHEKINGKGYPQKLKGEEISLFGKIFSIVDAYDMLTSPTLIRYAYTPFQALQIMIRDKCYDKKFLEIFIKLLGNRV